MDEQTKNWRCQHVKNGAVAQWLGRNSGILTERFYLIILPHGGLLLLFFKHVLAPKVNWKFEENATYTIIDMKVWRVSLSQKA